jgi:hypothetical protein
MENSEKTPPMDLSQPDPALKRLFKPVGNRPFLPMGCPGQYRHPFGMGGDLYRYLQRGWQLADRRLATG